MHTRPFRPPVRSSTCHPFCVPAGYLTCSQRQMACLMFCDFILRIWIPLPRSQGTGFSFGVEVAVKRFVRIRIHRSRNLDGFTPDDEQIEPRLTHFLEGCRREFYALNLVYLRRLTDHNFVQPVYHYVSGK